MKYMLMIYGDEAAMQSASKTDMEQMHGAYMAYSAELDSLSGDGRLAQYQPYWAARADLLARAGDTDAAVQAYERAIGLESDPAVRQFLQERLVKSRQ